MKKLKIYNVKYLVAGLISIGMASLVCAIIIYTKSIIGTASFLAGIFFLAGCYLVRVSYED